MMSTTAKGFDCDWCGRYFEAYVSKYIAEGLVLCPVCYKKNFLIKERKTWEV